MKRKLLLADDSPTIQKVIQLCFAEEAFEVHVATDGASAVNLLRRLRPDILLADVLLPGLDGYELCMRAKKDNRIPVILLVGTFEPFDFSRAEACGYDAYLTKPFDTSHLVETVKRLAGEGEKQAEEQAPVKAGVLEFELEQATKKPGILEMQDFRPLPAWEHEIVPQPEIVLPPAPIYHARVEPAVAVPGSFAEVAAPDVEIRVAAAVERLAPGWIENIRKELLEEVKRTPL